MASGDGLKAGRTSLSSCLGSEGDSGDMPTGPAGREVLLSTSQRPGGMKGEMVGRSGRQGMKRPSSQILLGQVIWWWLYPRPRDSNTYLQDLPPWWAEREDGDPARRTERQGQISPGFYLLVLRLLNQSIYSVNASLTSF